MRTNIAIDDKLMADVLRLLTRQLEA
ncbi:type II toxin-antitoxin system VapB family antitoxin [Leptothrix ochracea]